MYGIFECFADTIVICSLTALTIICSGVEIPFGVKPGSELITAAFATVFGNRIASLFVAVALTLFAFTTILGWSLYGISLLPVPVRSEGRFQSIKALYRRHYRRRRRFLASTSFGISPIPSTA